MEKQPQHDEINDLKKLARKSRTIQMKLRYDTVRLNLEGRTITEVAGILDLTYHTARNYITAYEKSGIEGLSIKKPPGRPKKMTEDQEQQLYECISTRLPKDVGFIPFVNWTAPLACKWVLKEFGMNFTERGMRDVFYRLKLSYTRPTYTLKKADPRKQDAIKIDFEEIKKKISQCRMLLSYS